MGGRIGGGRRTGRGRVIEEEEREWVEGDKKEEAEEERGGGRGGRRIAAGSGVNILELNFLSTYRALC